jgi:hypothetical protein
MSDEYQVGALVKLTAPLPHWPALKTGMVGRVTAGGMSWGLCRVQFPQLGRTVLVHPRRLEAAG